MTWNCHVGDSINGRYEIILGRDISTVLELNLKLHEKPIKSDDGSLEESLVSMVDLSTYEFKAVNTGKITPQESFMNAY